MESESNLTNFKGLCSDFVYFILPEISHYREQNYDLIYFLGYVYIVDVNKLNETKSNSETINLIENSLRIYVDNYKKQFITELNKYLLLNVPDLKKISYYDIDGPYDGYTLTFTFLNVKSTLVNFLFKKIKSLENIYTEDKIKLYENSLIICNKNINELKNTYYFPYFRKDYITENKNKNVLETIIKIYKNKIFLYNLKKLIDFEKNIYLE